MLGEVIHGYRIERALSGDKGGFGDVYFATHVDSGAEAVVKVLKPEMSALRDIVTRFFNEARAAASIHHPGIVQIHNVGYHGERAYLLMERLRGDDLETRLAGGPLPVDRAVVFMRQAAGAIGAAHDRGIVHRDLKPANLFVVADPDVVGGERVKVLDFGIAKLTVDAGAGKTQGVFGTPSYMSPEQCASSGAVDGRADLYSLGCIFYELVCGRPPFGHGGIELIAAHLRDTPAPPRALAPWLPAAIELVILRLLEKQPDRRIGSAAALVAALDEAALASGLAGASVPHLPIAGPAASGPHLRSGGPFTQRIASPSTLGSAAGAASTLPPRRRGLGLWLGVGAIVVVGGAVAALVATGGHGAPSPGGPGDAGVALAAPVDAAPRAAVAPDAAFVAAAPADAAVVAVIPPDASPGPTDPADGSGAPTQRELAERANEDGKERLNSNHPEQAIRKFEEACARDPQAKFFLNLCTAQFLAGRFDDALGACAAVEQTAPTAGQRTRAAKLIDRIKAEARSQHIELRGSTGPERPPEPEEPKAADHAAEALPLKKAGDAAMFASPMRAEEAISLYSRAYALSPTPEALFDVAFAQFAAHRCAQARGTLRKLGAAAPTGPLAVKVENLRSGLPDCVEDGGKPR